MTRGHRVIQSPGLSLCFYSKRQLKENEHELTRGKLALAEEQYRQPDLLECTWFYFFQGEGLITFLKKETLRAPGGLVG